MATVRIGRNDLTVHLSTLEKLGGLSRDLTIPRSAITAARYSDDLFAEKRGLRVGGTSIPGRIRLGHFATRSGTDFLAVHGTRSGVVLELNGQRYARVLVSLPEDEARRVIAQL